MEDKFGYTVDAVMQPDTNLSSYDIDWVCKNRIYFSRFISRVEFAEKESIEQRRYFT